MVSSRFELILEVLEENIFRTIGDIFLSVYRQYSKCIAFLLPKNLPKVLMQIEHICEGKQCSSKMFNNIIGLVIKILLQHKVQVDEINTTLYSRKQYPLVCFIPVYSHLAFLQSPHVIQQGHLHPFLIIFQKLSTCQCFHYQN